MVWAGVTCAAVFTRHPNRNCNALDGFTSMSGISAGVARRAGGWPGIFVQRGPSSFHGLAQAALPSTKVPSGAARSLKPKPRTDTVASIGQSKLQSQLRFRGREERFPHLMGGVVGVCLVDTQNLLIKFRSYLLCSPSLQRFAKANNY